MNIKKFLSAAIASALIFTSSVSLTNNVKAAEAENTDIIADDPAVLPDDDSPAVVPDSPDDSTVLSTLDGGQVLYPIAEGYERAYPPQAENDAAEIGPQLISPASSVTLQPLTEHYVTVELTTYDTTDDLKSVKLADIIGNMKDKDGNVVSTAQDAKYVWIRFDEYSIIDKDSTVDLTRYYSSSVGDKPLENADMIIGTAKQLCATDEVYHVTFKITTVSSLPNIADAIKLYTMDGDTRNDLQMSKNSSRYNDQLDVYFSGLPSEDSKVYVDLDPEKVTLTKLSSDETQSEVKANSASVSCGKDNSLRKSYTSYGNDRIAMYYGTLTVNYTYLDKEHTAQIILYAEPLRLRIDEYVYANTNDSTSHLLSGRSSEVSRSDNGLTYNVIKTLPESYGDVQCGAYFYLRTNDDLSVSDCVNKAVVGNYNSSTDIPANAADIKDSLFTYNTRYSSADYTSESGIDFTIILDGSNDKIKPLLSGDATEYVVHVNIKAQKTESSSNTPNTPSFNGPDIDNSFLYLDGVYDNKGYTAYYNAKYLNESYKLYYDTYTKLHYQTALIYEDEDHKFDLSNLKLDVRTTDGVNVYESTNPTKPIDFKNDPQDFSNGEVAYTVAANGGQGTYFINIQKNVTGGAKLFVNGPQSNKEREVYFDSVYGEDYHDIIIANIGDQPLNNVKAVLSDDAQNVELDGYWQLDGSEGASTLPAFTPNSNGSLAKIRLKPKYTIDEDGDKVIVSGEVKGTITITADGQDTVTIKLSGHAGNPQIITESPITDAVKYVPHQTVIATDNIHDWIKPTFDIYSGKLPEGIELNGDTGELYGTPLETGKFSFGVDADFEVKGSGNTYVPNCYKWFELTVLDNTNTNVYDASDENYDLKTPIGTEQTAGRRDYVLSSTEAGNDQLFVSNGEYDKFINGSEEGSGKVWLNGVLLAPDDYTSESGSTKITVKSQTLERLPKNQMNTIAAEFRIDDGSSPIKVMKRTAQNFSIGQPTDTSSRPAPSNPPAAPSTSNTLDTSSSSEINSSTDADTSSSSEDSSTSSDTSSTSEPENSTSTEPTDESESSGTSSTKPIDVPDTAGDLIFTPVDTNGITDNTLATIIETVKIYSPAGVLPEDAVLIVKPDTNITVTNGNGAALDITFVLNGEEVQPDGNVTVQVDIPDYLAGRTLYVYHIEYGKYVYIPSTIRDGKIYFTANHFSTYVITDNQLDENGNVISGTSSPDSSDPSSNPNTGIGISVFGVLLTSGTILFVLNKKKNKK